MAIPYKDSLAATHPHVASEWDHDKNDAKPTDYPHTSQRRFFWKCAEGHTAEMSIKNRAKAKTPCIYCADRKVWPGFNDLATRHPELAHQWSDQNELQASEILPQSRDSALWVCPKEGHVWTGKIAARTAKGTDCAYCAGREALKGFNDLETLRPEIAADWDYDLNEGVPSDYTAKASVKVHWKCPNGHKQLLSINNRSVNRHGGCGSCR